MLKKEVFLDTKIHGKSILKYVILIFSFFGDLVNTIKYPKYRPLLSKTLSPGLWDKVFVGAALSKNQLNPSPS